MERERAEERVRLLDDESVLKVDPALRVEGLGVAVVTICAYAADAAVRILVRLTAEEL